MLVVIVAGFFAILRRSTAMIVLMLLAFGVGRRRGRFLVGGIQRARRRSECGDPCIGIGGVVERGCGPFGLSGAARRESHDREYSKEDGSKHERALFLNVMLI